MNDQQFITFSLVFTVQTIGPRDVIFLIDSTMGTQGLNSVREFIKHFTDSAPIGPNDVQIGIAQFAATPRLEMDLNTHSTRDGIVAALGAIRPRSGQTVNIGAALDFVRTNMLRPERGSRIQRGVLQLILLVTGKTSSDGVEEAARQLLRMGVLTLAVGARSASEEELRKVAFTESAAYNLRDIRLLGRVNTPTSKKIMNALTTLAGVVVTEVPTEPGNFIFVCGAF